MKTLRRFLEGLGRAAVLFAADVGQASVLLVKTARWALRFPQDGRELARQMVRIGIASLPVVTLTALFSGMVIALQMYQGFYRFRAASFAGGVVALSIFREVGPVFTALLVTARAGGAIAAELGTMRQSEQIDALVAMGTEPLQYLFVPRIVSGVVMLPLLQVLANAVALAGGRTVTVGLLNANPYEYDRSTFRLLELSDLNAGIIKAAVFGLILTSVACVRGYLATSGAEGVGGATTRAVVQGSLGILIADFLLSKLMF
jgi:phospholipid/cholesterol/gamma-HCH transport system permease protein